MSETIRIAQLMEQSGVQFGTSGARGLVEQMTDRVCYAYTAAFIQHLRDSGQLGDAGQVAVAGDLRPSSRRIMTAACRAIADQGLEALNCGTIPTPAVAYYGMRHGMPSLMVTGSHIPDDRNGIKFNTPQGEILKEDETAIRLQTVTVPDGFDERGMFRDATAQHLPPVSDSARTAYVDRYVQFFESDALAGLRIGLYEHSTVARDVFLDALRKLGADVTRLGYSETFLPVDTEAIRAEDVELARKWAQAHDFDAIISADGDGDRPLVSDEHGKWLRGDVAGILCARALGARVVVTPVSSNSAVEKSGFFAAVHRTRIGSPYVIAGMQLAARDNVGPVVGYEANGGFLTGDDVVRGGRRLTALPTRDALLVAVAVLQDARSRDCTLSELVAQLPPRYTTSDRIKNFPTELSRERLTRLQQDPTAIAAVFGPRFGRISHTDTTDGLRMTFENGEVVHLRPSGNAPELRCYNEADSEQRAQEINHACMEILAGWQR